MRFKSLLAGSALLALSSFSAVPALAAVFLVDAAANSSSGGVGVNTISLTTGQGFSVSADPLDLWNAGSLPRWSNANGLIGPNLYATGTDESGQSSGTLIGAAYPTLYTQGGLTAAFGSLVGQIGSGAFFLIGTSYTGTASADGVLKLFYWDSNNFDNTQNIEVNVSAVPEASTWAMMLIGFAGLGFAAYRRTKSRDAAAAAA